MNGHKLHSKSSEFLIEYYADKIKEDGMDELCSACRTKNSYTF